MKKRMMALFLCLAMGCQGTMAAELPLEEEGWDSEGQVSMGEEESEGWEEGAVSYGDDLAAAVNQGLVSDAAPAEEPLLPDFGILPAGEEEGLEVIPWYEEYSQDKENSQNKENSQDKEDSQIEADLSEEAWVGAEEAGSGTCGENLTWSLDPEGTLTISGTGKMEDYEEDSSAWPPRSNAPWGTEVHRAVIEEGVTSVGNYAFFNCTLDDPEPVRLPESITSIGEAVFYESDLKSIILPEGLQSIGEEAFKSCSELLTVTIPGGVTQIGKNTFQYCSNLKRIILSEGVKSIADHAFDRCLSLTAAVIPGSVEKIGKKAFADAEDDLVLYGEKGSYAEAYAKQRGLPFKEVGEYDLLGTEYVDSGACGDALSWTLDQEGTLRISGSGRMWDFEEDYDEASSRWKRNHIRRIVIEEGVTSIGKNAFVSFYGGITVRIPDSVTEIEERAFGDRGDYDDGDWLEIVIEASWDSAAYDFAMRNQIPFVSVSSPVTGLRVAVDEENYPLLSIDRVSLPGIRDRITCMAVYEDGRESMLRKEDLIIEFDTAGWVVGGNENTVTFRYGDAVLSINFPVYYFGDIYRNEPEVVLEETRRISYYFEEEYDDEAAVCRFVPPVDGVYRFDYVGDTDDWTDNHLYDYMGTEIKMIKDTEEYCTASLKEGETYFLFLQDDEDGSWDVTVHLLESETPVVGRVLTASDGSIYKVTALNNQVSLKSMPGSVTNLVVPDTVVIGGVTYYVTSIGKNAFKGNKSLKSVTMDVYITSIEKGAFRGCTNLKKVTIGDFTTIIGAGAFRGCTKLASVNIPKRVKSVGENAFYGCGKLKKISIKSKKLDYQTLGDGAFENIYKKVKITVPAARLTFYEMLLRDKGVSPKGKIGS